MTPFDATRLPVQPVATAPDGTDVRPLLQLAGGSLAHFELPPGAVSHAVRHRTVEEIWYCLSGRGEMWRQQGAVENVIPLDTGTALTIPLGTAFQFRSFGYEPLVVLVITMPPWPGEGEAERVEGKWRPTVGHGG